MRAGFRLDQLHVDPKPVDAALHAAFQDIAHVEFAPYLSEVEIFTLIGEGGVAADHEGAGDAGKISREALGYPVGEIVLIGTTADVRERQHDHG